MITYLNGNCDVSIDNDGTKIRRWPDGEKPLPIWPESVDLKITDFCDRNCDFCYEGSSEKGEHAEWSEQIANIFGGSHPDGIEIAVGGGDPFSHPSIKPILYLLRGLGYIVNITTNSVYIDAEDGVDVINQCIKEGLVKGIGVSDTALVVTGYEHIVKHYIVGVGSPCDALKCEHQTLVLGFKKRGRGLEYYKKNADKIDANIEEWRWWLPAILKRGRVSFDNLALEQLKVKEVVSEEVWDKHFMGDDGRFTMYIDLVRKQFSISSNHDKRWDIGDMNLSQMFRVVRKATDVD